MYCFSFARVNSKQWIFFFGWWVFAPFKFILCFWTRVVDLIFFYFYSTCRRSCLTVNEVTDPNGTSTLFLFSHQNRGRRLLSNYRLPHVSFWRNASKVLPLLLDCFCFFCIEIIADKPNCGDTQWWCRRWVKKSKAGESTPPPFTDFFWFVLKVAEIRLRLDMLYFFLSLECVGASDVRKCKNQMSTGGTVSR